jgi:SAM-dependent methyltransferase
VVYDPQAFRGTATYYSRGRPPYSPSLGEILAEALGLDGTGRLLDIGCGPGVVLLELASHFAAAVGLDPEAGMLAEARRRAAETGQADITWVTAVAEDLPSLDISPCRLVTFGQSFHRVQRLAVAEAVYDLLEPGGAIALIAHAVDGRDVPPNPGHPTIPHDDIRDLIIDSLGEETRAHLTAAAVPQERFAETLARTRFRATHTYFAPGRNDLVYDVDTVVAMYFSMSYAAPPRFGTSRIAFEDALRQLLLNHSPEGLFWEWPGDTEIVVATKPGTR